MSNNEPVTSFTNDIKSVVELGTSWGMSDSEIQNCLEVVAKLNENHSSNNNNNDNGTRQHSSTKVAVIAALRFAYIAIKNVVGLIAVVAFVMFSFYTAMLFICSQSPELEQSIGKVTAPMIYPTMRAARMMLKPVADVFDISRVYASDCLIDNPYFLDPIDDCGPCHKKSKLLDMTGHSVKKMIRNIEELNPFVIKGYMKTKVDLPMLQKMYFENERQFKLGGTRMFNSNLDDVFNITDFFYKYNHEDLMNVRMGTGYLAWDTNSVPSSQAIRKVFPRPIFVMSHSEVSLIKRIYIEGPIAGGHELPVGGFANAWYLQAHGARRVRLIPHAACSEECKDMKIELQAGDLVWFQDQFWRFQSEPTIGSGVKEISVGFTGSFTI